MWWNLVCMKLVKKETKVGIQGSCGDLQWCWLPAAVHQTCLSAVCLSFPRFAPLVDWQKSKNYKEDHFWHWTTQDRAIVYCRLCSFPLSNPSMQTMLFSVKLLAISQNFQWSYFYLCQNLTFVSPKECIHDG